MLTPLHSYTFNSFDEVKDFQPPLNSAKIVNKDGQPAYSVEIAGATQVLTVEQVLLKFLGSLYGSASNFIGKPIEQAIFSVPAGFTPAQCEALKKVSLQAKVDILQIIPAAGAAAMTYGLTDAPTPQFPAAVSRDAVVLDVGGTSTTATVLSIRDGLLSVRGTNTAAVGGEDFDAKLVDFFAKEFTKKTKTTWDPQDHRAVAKLTLEVESTKRTLSASTTGPCSIESLAQGIDFSGTVNRTRFDLISGPVYSRILNTVTEALKAASLDAVQIQQVILAGASCRLPSLANKVVDLFPESTTLTNSLDADEIIAMGCALQAQLLSHQKHSSEVSVQQQVDQANAAPALSKPVGLLLGANQASSPFSVLLDSHTPLPARKMFEVNAPTKDVVLSLWEGENSVHVEQPPAKDRSAKKADGESDEDDDFEEEPTKTAVSKATRVLCNLAVKVSSADGEEKPQRVRVTLLVEKDGKGSLSAQQVSAGGAEVFKASF